MMSVPSKAREFHSSVSKGVVLVMVQQRIENNGDEIKEMKCKYLCVCVCVNPCVGAREAIIKDKILSCVPTYLTS